MNNTISGIYRWIIGKFLPADMPASVSFEKKTNSSWKNQRKKIIPWAAAVLFLAYLFHSVDHKKLIDVLLNINLPLFLPGMMIFGVVSFLIDTQNLKILLEKFDYDVPYRKIFQIRGITYLAMIIDYSIGMGSVSLYLKKKLNIPIMRGASIMLVQNSATQNSLAFIASSGCLLSKGSTITTNNILMFCMIILSVSVIIITALKKLPERKWVSGFKKLDFIKVFHELGWKDYISVTLWRSVYYMTFIVFFCYSFHVFHIKIPAAVVLAFIPMTLLVSSLPVTPLGLGTSQAAMIYFFRDYAPEETILAVSLIYSVSLIIIRGFIGILFLSNIQERLPGVQRY